MNKSLKHYLELHFVVVLLGFTAILGKLIQLSAEALVMYRTGLTVFGIFLLSFSLKIPFRLKTPVIFKLLGIGLVVALHWYTFFEAAKISNVSISLIGLSTGTLWVAFLKPFVEKTKISWLEIGLGIAVVLGMCIIFKTESQHSFGLWLSVVSGLLAAIFTLANGQFTNHVHSLSITCYEMLGAFLVCLFYTLFSAKTLPIPNPSDWFWLSILAFVCSVYAYSAIVRLLKHIPTFSVNLAVTLEPVYGILLAYFIFGTTESMTIGFYIGSLIILASVFIYQKWGNK